MPTSSRMEVPGELHCEVLRLYLDGLLFMRQFDKFVLGESRTEAPTGRYQVDLLAEIASPAGATAVLAVEVKRTLEPRSVLQAVEQISAITNRALPRAVPVVAASYLSPRPCHPS